MTVCDLIYVIGCAVAFLMAFNGIESQQDKEPGDSPFILFLSFAASFLSWGLPIYWIGNEIYERKFKRKNNEVQNDNR